MSWGWALFWICTGFIVGALLIVGVSNLTAGIS